MMSGKPLKPNSSDGNDLQSYLILKLNKVNNSIPKTNDGASLNQFVRSFSLNQYTTCDDPPTSSSPPSSLCKSHEKLWFSDRDVLIANGAQAGKGYLTDFYGTNNDILFENAFSFVDAYNNMYNRVWGKHTIGPFYTSGPMGTGPYNPNWGKMNGNEPNKWTPNKGNAFNPVDKLGCSACGTQKQNGFCKNNYSMTKNDQKCYYNLK